LLEGYTFSVPASSISTTFYISSRAIIVNSKVGNVGTGEEGIKNARRMVIAVSKEFNIPQEEVIMSSTGVIAKQVPIEIIENGVRGISRDLQSDPIVGAKGIMTTDTYPKALSILVDEAVITIVGKGSGMIEPNMATMLVYIFTDAEIEVPVLDNMLREAVYDSFNMLSVDTDTSTSDTCIIMANGLAGKVDERSFLETLKFACVEMTKMLARDGEGATKLLLANVLGAKSDEEARFIAKALINSPLIKTMAYGTDPNVGRILMAVGKCTACEIKPDKIEVRVNDKPVYLNENRVDFDEKEVRNLLSRDIIGITVDLKVGSSSATAYGCDLTEGYIKENAAYYSS
jgi:glutamate N-acetyltransferase/amino-acid N-acetyltransferase